MSSNLIEYKFILIGNSDVGKTSLFKKLITGEFSPQNMSTIGVDKSRLYSQLTIDKDNKSEKLNFEIILYDSAGQEKFRSIAKSYFKQADGIILLYDVTKRESFEQIKVWIESLEETLGKIDLNSNKYIVILLGNKIDLGKKVIDEEEARDKCKESNILWGGEISVKTFTKEQLKEKIDLLVIELYKRIGAKKTGNQKSKKIVDKKKKPLNCFFFN